MTTDRTMDTRAALATLRPQPIGSGHPGRIIDPLVEPLWTGVRALAAVDRDGVVLSDEDGASITRAPVDHFAIGLLINKEKMAPVNPTTSENAINVPRFKPLPAR